MRRKRNIELEHYEFEFRKTMQCNDIFLSFLEHTTKELNLENLLFFMIYEAILCKKKDTYDLYRLSEKYYKNEKKNNKRIRKIWDIFCSENMQILINNEYDKILQYTNIYIKNSQNKQIDINKYDGDYICGFTNQYIHNNENKIYKDYSYQDKISIAKIKCMMLI